MSAPNVTFTASGTVISAVTGFDFITVRFSADEKYTAFECRATPAAAEWGRGKGTLVASFSSTPAGTERSFEIYDDYLTAGDGAYRISLYVQGEDGSWNDNGAFIPLGSTGLVTADGHTFLSMRE